MTISDVTFLIFTSVVVPCEWIFVWAVILPQVANQTGWFAAEMGRQPWVVYGLLRTSDALSKAVTANQVLFSLILFFIIYALLLALFLYMMNKKMQHGPVLFPTILNSRATK